ncbi:MAG: hypothetical protein JNM99_09525 [Verrucomicrobiaceae bacterium]|nr:hypothetical protein [Verrucomicrobiaceae bacterium]
MSAANKPITSWIIFLVFVALVQSCTENRPTDQVNVNYPPSTVGALLELHNVPFPAVTFMDEPPGKLRTVLMTAGSLQIEAALRYAPTLFSVERTWSEANVKAARIERLVYSNIPHQETQTVAPRPAAN